MRSATLPAVRVEPELRDDVEQLLQEGETLSQFVENSVRDEVRRRRDQSEFIARGLKSLADARKTGKYVDADTVLAKLDTKLDAAKKAAARRK